MNELFGVSVIRPEASCRIVRGYDPSRRDRLTGWLGRTLPEILFWWLLFLALTVLGA